MQDTYREGYLSIVETPLREHVVSPPHTTDAINHTSSSFMGHVYCVKTSSVGTLFGPLTLMSPGQFHHCHSD